MHNKSVDKAIAIKEFIDTSVVSLPSESCKS